MFIINGILWEIELVPYNSLGLLKADGETYALGACANNEKIIYLREDLPPVLKKKVLCHEIVHAAMFSYEVLLEPMQEELMADIIATYGEEIIIITNILFANLQKEKKRAC